MAQPPAKRALSSDDLSGKTPEENLQLLIEMLNPNLSATSVALNKGISLSENTNVVEKEITIETPPMQWTTPTLVNSWVALGGTTLSPRYRINDEGVVFIEGNVKSGTPPSVIFTLPVGYRPEADIGFAVTSNGAFGTLSVTSTGDVTASVGSGTSFALSSSFSAINPSPQPAFVGAGWPLYVSYDQPQPILAVLIAGLQDITPQSTTGVMAGPNLSHSGAAVHWENAGNGKIVVRRISRLSPSRKYKLTLLLFPKA